MPTQWTNPFKSAAAPAKSVVPIVARPILPLGPSAFPAKAKVLPPGSPFPATMPGFADDHLKAGYNGQYPRDVRRANPLNQDDPRTAGPKPVIVAPKPVSAAKPIVGGPPRFVAPAGKAAPAWGKVSTAK